LVTALAGGALTTAAAYGQSACSPGDTSLSCRLVGVLHWLEAMAVVLAIVLVLVIGVAVYLFRRNRARGRTAR
jgi:hypothetical protein